MYLYEIINSKCFSQDIGSYGSFGIRALAENGEVVVTISDISTDCAFVKKIADLCTTLELSPMHLHDVVVDKLSELQ